MNVRIPGVTPPQGATLSIQIELTAQANITAFAARQKATRFAVMEISSQILGDTPELVIGERLCWSVPLFLTSPEHGKLGKIGDVLVDASTGEVLADTETVQRITGDARRLAECSAL